MSTKRDRERNMRQRLGSSTQSALWAFQVVYDLQTDEEKFVGRDLGVRDGVGFTPPDTERMNRLYGDLCENGWLMSAAVADMLKASMPKYAGQVLSATSNAKETRARRSA